MLRRNTSIKRILILLIFIYLAVGGLVFYFWPNISSIVNTSPVSSKYPPTLIKPHFDEAIIHFPHSHSIFVRVAQTPNQKKYGLMFQKKLAPYHGMLFIFSSHTPLYSEQIKQENHNQKKKIKERKKQNRKFANKNNNKKRNNNQNIYMWMKNTYISLDMIFLDKNNCVIAIKRHLPPLDVHLISLPQKTTKVIELQIDKSKNIRLSNHSCALIYKKK